VAVGHGVVIEIISNPNIFSDSPWLKLGFLSIPVTVFWIVAITNSVNFIDGLDGLAVGVSSISSIQLLIIAILVSEPEVAINHAALAGACIGFMPYKLNPAKIFKGDNRGDFYRIYSGNNIYTGLVQVFTQSCPLPCVFILALPDIRYLLCFLPQATSRQESDEARQGHVHHRLIDMGFNQKQAVAIMYTLSGIFGLTAVVLTASGELRAMLFILGVIVVGVNKRARFPE
jgi:UDP-GlcNAc:undecaprenyl-phosphate GlcNAc-1-phosphate transferase